MSKSANESSLSSSERGEESSGNTGLGLEEVLLSDGKTGLFRPLCGPEDVVLMSVGYEGLLLPLCVLEYVLKPSEDGGKEGSVLISNLTGGELEMFSQEDVLSTGEELTTGLSSA